MLSEMILWFPQAEILWNAEEKGLLGVDQPVQLGNVISGEAGLKEQAKILHVQLEASPYWMPILALWNKWSEYFQRVERKVQHLHRCPPHRRITMRSSCINTFQNFSSKLRGRLIARTMKTGGTNPRIHVVKRNVPRKYSDKHVYEGSNLSLEVPLHLHVHQIHWTVDAGDTWHPMKCVVKGVVSMLGKKLVHLRGTSEFTALEPQLVMLFLSAQCPYLLASSSPLKKRIRSAARVELMHGTVTCDMIRHLTCIAKPTK